MPVTDHLLGLFMQKKLGVAIAAALTLGFVGGALFYSGGRYAAEIGHMLASNDGVDVVQVRQVSEAGDDHADDDHGEAGDDHGESAGGHAEEGAGAE